MKTIRYFLLAGVIWLANSCGDPLEDFGVHISPAYYEYFATFTLYDVADTEQLLQGASVSIEGSGSQYIYNYDGTKSFDITNGALSLILGPEIEPTEDNPVEFIISISKTGYEPRSFIASFSPGMKFLEQSLFIFSRTDLPEGTSKANLSASINSTGELSSPVLLDITPPTGSPRGASISLPQGTLFFDSNGMQLTGSSLEIEVILFDALAESTQAMWPIIAFEEDEDISILPRIGFPVLDIQMEINGQRVKSFQNGQVSFTMELPDEITDPSSGQVLQPGDSLDIFSAESYSSRWEKLDPSVLETVNGMNQVSGTSDHLSLKAASTREGPEGMVELILIDKNGNPVGFSKYDIISPTGRFDLLNPKYSAAIRTIPDKYVTPPLNPGKAYQGYFALFYSGYSIEVETVTGDALTDFELISSGKTGAVFWGDEIPTFVYGSPTYESPSITIPFEIYCNSDRAGKYYPPIGFQFQLKDGEQIVYSGSITKNGTSELTLPGVEENKQYTLFGFHPSDPGNTYFFLPVTLQNNVLLSIGLIDSQCAQLKKLLPGQ